MYNAFGVAGNAPPKNKPPANAGDIVHYSLFIGLKKTAHPCGRAAVVFYS
jgi:hypothetical protein